MNELYRRGQSISQNKSPPPEGLFSMLPTKLWRRRLLFARVFAAIFIPAVAIALLYPKMYSASGMVIIGERAPQGSNSVALLQRLGDPADLEGQILILKSERLLRLVLARPGVLDVVRKDCESSGMFRALGESSRSAKCENMFANDGDVMSFVGNNYVIAAVGRSRVISASYVSAVPEVAFIMANSLIMTYLEDQNAENMRDRDAAAEWLRKRGQTAPAADPMSTLKRSFSNEFFDKVRELEKEPRMLGGSARLLSLAEVPTLPYFPKKVPIFAAAFIMAFLLAAFAALIKDASDPTVRSRSDLEELTRLPVLATVPSVNRLQMTYEQPVTQHDSRTAAIDRLRQVSDLLDHPSPETSPFKDAYFTLFAKMIASRSGTAFPLKKLLVTSGARGEGKTKTALALAMTAAASGRRVLLVDCQYGGESLPAPTGKNRPTMLDVVNGDATPEAAVSSTLHRNLYVMNGAPGLIAPTVLLSERFPEFLQWSDRYDLVIFDGAALGERYSSHVLAPLVDGVLLCARWGVTRNDDLVTTASELAASGVKVLGIVITMANLKDMKLHEVTARTNENPRFL